MVNVGTYTIHGSYGICRECIQPTCEFIFGGYYVQLCALWSKKQLYTILDEITGGIHTDTVDGSEILLTSW